jgi:hypothetical protein
MATLLDKMQTRKTVLKRTRTRPDLPSLVLYLETVSGQPKRRVLDAEGKEHLLDESVLQSQYKLVTGAQAKELIDKHWPKARPAVKPAS